MAGCEEKCRECVSCVGLDGLVEMKAGATYTRVSPEHSDT